MEGRTRLRDRLLWWHIRLWHWLEQRSRDDRTLAEYRADVAP